MQIIKSILIPVFTLVLFISGCSTNEPNDGNIYAGDCATIGEIVKKNGYVAICLHINGENKYLISGPAIEDIKLLAGVNWLELYLSDEGQDLVSEGVFTYADFAGLDVETLNLKRFIVDKPEWKDVASLILESEEAWAEVKNVEREYCPQLKDDPNAFCAPKIMSDEGMAMWFEASDSWNAVVERLDKEIELIGVYLEGQYQIDDFLAAKFVLERLRP